MASPQPVAQCKARTTFALALPPLTTTTKATLTLVGAQQQLLSIRRGYRSTTTSNSTTSSSSAGHATNIVHGEIVQEEETIRGDGILQDDKDRSSGSSTSTTSNLPLMEQHFRANHRRLEMLLQQKLNAYQQASESDDLLNIQQALIDVRGVYEDLNYWDQALRCEERLEMFWTTPTSKLQESDTSLTTTTTTTTSISSDHHNNNQLHLAHSWYRRGRYHMHMGLPADAAKLYQKALDEYHAYYGKDTFHADKGQVYLSMGGLQYAKGLHSQALKILQQESEPHFRKHNGGTSSIAHPNLFKCLQHQGLLCREMEDYSQALQLYQQAKEFWKEISPDVTNAEERAKLQSIELDIADMHLALDELQEALDMYRSIWEQDRIHRDRDEKGETPLTGMDGLMLHNIGRIYAQQGEDTLATETLQDAVEMKRAWFGPAHAELAKSLQLLGAVYARQEQKYEALRCFELCLSIARYLAKGDDSDAGVMLALRNIALLEGKKVPRWSVEESHKESSNKD